MDLYLVRHAHAGSRSSWEGRDLHRPLSKKGRRQADAIADLLAEAGIERLLSSPARRCVQTLEPLAAQSGTKLRLDLPDGAVTVPGDAGQLRQVLTNLVENAIKYGGKGGPVEIALETKVAQVRRQLERGEVRVLFDARTESVNLVRADALRNADDQ